jgi:tetratricopeptide (TPR) repeat protein
MVTDSNSAEHPPEFELLPQSQVIRLIAQSDRREFTLFLGAGASRSSGVLLASEMIEEWQRMAFEDRAPAGADFDSWCKKQPWFGKEEAYSMLFEMLFPNPRARQKYVEPKIEVAFPGWCYLYLANVVKDGYFNVIFTTNFDDLINDALTMYLGYNPVVCAADSEVENISITTDRAKIIKLHGDYLFQRLKNTIKELQQLDPNMEHKVKEFGKQCGMVVIGYAGRDHSVMRVIEEVIKDEKSFPSGIYWGVRPEDVNRIAPRVQELARNYRKLFHLFECPDFDLFMSRLHTAWKLKLPGTVMQPYESIKEKYNQLVKKATERLQNDPIISAHKAELEYELNRPWAKETDLAALNLLQARMALGQRDYKTALSLVSKYCQERPGDADALTTWGDALAVQGEEEYSDAASEEAATKWREAIRLNQRILTPRYSLARYYWRTQKLAEGIAVVEELLKLVPNDTNVRRNLISLYTSSSRYEDALKEIEWLLSRDKDSADLHAMKASVLEQRGLIEQAQHEIRRATELNPKNAAYHFMLGNSLARVGKLDEAAFAFNQAIQLDPRNLNYRLQAISFYWMQQKPALALQHAEAAARIEPSSAEVRGWLGQLYFTLGRMMESQREIEGALKLSPQDSRLLFNAGVLYSNLQRFDRAETCFRQASQSNPGIPQPYYMLCMLYWAHHRGSDLQVVFQRLKEVAPPVAQQLQMQLQMLDQQFRGNRVAAFQSLQRQSLAWLQTQSQSGQPQQQGFYGSPTAGSGPRLPGVNARR